MAAMIEMLDDTLSTRISDVWGRIHYFEGSKSQPLPNDNTLIVAWGCSQTGRSYDSIDKLKKEWKQICYLGWNQDIYLYCNGKLIRAIHNFKAKLITKTAILGNSGRTEYVNVQYRKFHSTTV